MDKKEDLRVVKTRENITNQFIECLRQNSFYDISVKMLIEQSRINRSTFYRNYEDKYDLLNRLLTFLLDEFKDSIDSRFVSMHYANAKEYHPYLRKMIEYFRKYKRCLPVLWDASLPVNFYHEMTCILSDSIQNSIINCYKPCQEKAAIIKLYSELFAALTLSTARWWLSEEAELPIDKLIEIMTDNVEKGLFLSMENRFK